MIERDFGVKNALAPSKARYEEYSKHSWVLVKNDRNYSENYILGVFSSLNSLRDNLDKILTESDYRYEEESTPQEKKEIIDLIMLGDVYEPEEFTQIYREIARKY